LMAMVALLAACGGGGLGAPKVDHVIDLRVSETAGARHVVTGYGAAWFATQGVTPVDERSRKPGRSIPTPEPVNGLAIGEGGVFAALDDGSLARIDPERRVAGAPVRVGPRELGGDETAIAAGEGAVWVAVEDSVVPVDPVTGRRRPPIRVNGQSRTIEVGRGAVWAAIIQGTRRAPRSGGGPPEEGSILPRDRELVVDDTRSSRVVRIDPRTAEVTADVKVRGVVDLALLGDTLWTAADNRLRPLDPRTLRPSGETIEVADGDPTSIAAAGGAIWGAVRSDNRVIRVDPREGEVTGRWAVPSASGAVAAEIGEVAVGGDAVWIGSSVGGRVGAIDL